MHEMAIAANILELAQAELKANGLQRLRSLTIHYGRMSGIMPEALDMAFNELVRGSMHEGAVLRMICQPVRLRCVFCNHSFEIGNDCELDLACPRCGETFGHVVEQGKEMILARIEADRAAD